MQLSKFDPSIHHTRIHPLNMKIVQSSRFPGMCNPPQLYYCLSFFNYNRQRIEVYYVKKEDLGAKNNELLGTMFSNFRQEKWKQYNYMITIQDDDCIIQQYPLWDHEGEEPSYIDLEAFIDEEEEKELEVRKEAK